MSILERTVKSALRGPMPLLIFVAALLLGAFALQQTPREEEPQIVVPMLDIHVQAANTEAPEVERLVTKELEKLLSQIRGVEHIYSTTNTGSLVVTLRFEVGHNREQALIDTYAKLYAYQDTMAPIVTGWKIKPVEVDDVPIVMLGLYSKNEQLYDDYALTRFAQELATHLQSVPHSSEVSIMSGRTRTFYVYLDISALNAYQTTVSDVIYALSVSNELRELGSINSESEQWQIKVQSGDVLRTTKQLSELVVNVVNGQAIRLNSVARILDGPSEPTSYQWLQKSEQATMQPMVTLSVAKQRGANAVSVAQAVHEKMAELGEQILPPEVGVSTLRDYGETANDKVNNLTSSLVFAIVTVVVFLGVFLGWRPAIVVALALPICYGLALIFDFAFGYTINRVTLFALILALGLLVDDPITGIDNISRFLKGGRPSDEVIVNAISEIKVPLLMSTLTIIVAFIPLAFITGMMGPYMAPMAFNVPVSVAISTIVAFFVTPWLAKKILKKAPAKNAEEAPEKNLYSRFIGYLLASTTRIKWVLTLVVILFVLSASLPIFRAVPLKLLPYDNKSEVQVLIDMPEGTALADTAAFVSKVQAKTWSLNEVKEIAAYVGQPSSMDFNGMVRGYYRRSAANLAELRVLLVDKNQREHQSHAVVLRLRQLLKPMNQDGINIKVIEVPPGPPVLSTLVAEVYAQPFVSQETLHQAANIVAQRLTLEPHVEEVDTSLTRQQTQMRFETNQAKAALSAISKVDVGDTLEVATRGNTVGHMRIVDEAKAVPIVLSVPYEQRRISQLEALQVRGQQALSKQTAELGLQSAPRPMVALSELGEFKAYNAPMPIVRKDQRQVVYVYAELDGRTPADIIADVSADQNQDVTETPWQQRHFLNNGGTARWQLPAGTHVTFSGEGEWRITIDVFTDMGIAFIFALAAILVILRVQTRSMTLSLIIMSAIPLTVIGIMPGFWLLNNLGERVVAGAPNPVLFTATAMIGMIALAGIVVRNSLILVEFINQSRARGCTLKEALIQAGSVRMRPVLLTAGTTLLGNIVITLDPVFSGLAIAIIFGIISSTVFTLVVIPLVYYLVFRNEEQTHAA